MRRKTAVQRRNPGVTQDKGTDDTTDWYRTHNKFDQSEGKILRVVIFQITINQFTTVLIQLSKPCSRTDTFVYEVENIEFLLKILKKQTFVVKSELKNESGLLQLTTLSISSASLFHQTYLLWYHEQSSIILIIHIIRSRAI